MIGFDARDIRDVVETVWTGTLGVDVRYTDRSGTPPAQPICGSVHITGTWVGAVTVSVSERLARRVAGTMFGMTEADLGIEEIRDALGEIANITGGNVKALIDGSCQLSLPSVVSGGDYTITTPGAEVVAEVAFDCGGEVLVVRIIEGQPGRTGRRNAAE